MLFAATSGKALSSIWHRTNFASIANPVHVSPLPTRFRGGGGGNKTEGGGGVGKKRKRSSWITPSACNQRTGNVQRRFIKPIWVFRFRFDLPHRDLCPMLTASTILSLLEKKKNTPLPRAFSSLRINSLPAGYVCAGFWIFCGRGNLSLLFSFSLSFSSCLRFEKKVDI